MNIRQDILKGGVLFHDSEMPLAFLDIILPAYVPPTYTNDNGVANIGLYNSIYSGNSAGSVDELIAEIRKAKNDSSVYGMIISINCGGGTDVASDYLRTEIESFKKVKPIIAHGFSVFSGAYLSALGASLIIAGNNLSRFGSIGAYYSLDLYYRYLYNLFYQDIYAEESPDKNKAFRAWLEDEKNIDEYKRKASESANIFIDLVKKHRNGVSDKALTGDVYVALEAKKLGLIDGIGDYDYAVQRLKSLTKNYS